MQSLTKRMKFDHSDNSLENKRFAEHPLDTCDVKHALALRQSLDAMRRRSENCDVIVKVGEVEMPAHKNILIAQSEYFRTMFSNDFIENQSGVIDMSGMKYEPVKKVVDFFYTGKVSISEEGCGDLFYTANLMQAQPICDKIPLFLHRHLNPKSFFHTKKVAEMFDLEDLNEICDKFALEKRDLIVQEDGFNQLDFEYVSFLIVSGPGNEDSKLAIILRWIKADIENRRQLLLEMMNLIDLGKVSPSAIKYLVENESLVNQSVECMKMVILAAPNLANVRSKQPGVVSQIAREAVVTFDLSLKSLRGYNTTTKSWKNLHPLHDDMCSGVRYTSVAVGVFLHVFMANKNVYKINVMNHGAGWSRLENLLNHYSGISAVMHEHFIYISGSNSMERYHLRTNVSKEIRCANVPCNGCAMVVDDGHVYCIGGDRNGPLNTVNVLCCKTVTWSPSASMNLRRNAPAAVTFQDKIYVAGGLGTRDQGLSSVEWFDLKANIGTWTKLVKMLTPRSRFSLFVIDGRLHAAGNGQEASAIEEYDAEQNAWRVLLDKSHMRIMGPATVVTYLQW